MTGKKEWKEEIFPRKKDILSHTRRRRDVPRNIILYFRAVKYTKFLEEENHLDTIGMKRCFEAIVFMEFFL